MACAPNVDQLLAHVNGDAVGEAWILLTVVFNVVATGLLAWRLLRARQARSSRVRAALRVLAESAALYTAAGVAFAALFLADSPALGIFRALFNNLAVRAVPCARVLLADLGSNAVLEPGDHRSARGAEPSSAEWDRHDGRLSLPDVISRVLERLCICFYTTSK
jgi:hypothetical protein